MHVLFEGKPPPEPMYESTCHKCRSVFEFQEREAARYAEPRADDYLVVRCPICGNECMSGVECAKH